MLPPAEYEDTEGEDSAEEYGVLAEQTRHTNQGHSHSRASRNIPKNRKDSKRLPQANIEDSGKDKMQSEELRDLPMLDRFALQERERLEKIKQRRIEKIEQEKVVNAHNSSINNGSMNISIHNTSLMRHTRTKAPEEGRIKLEERARIMMEEKLVREEAERRKRAEALRQQELEACTFKPKLNKSKRTNLASKIPENFDDYQEKENQVDDEVIKQMAQSSNHKQKVAGSKSPGREVEREDRVSEMMKWGQNRDKKVYERVIAEEAALAQMRGTKKLPLKDIERLGERMYAAQQAIEKKRKAQADHEFVSTCTFKPAINQKSVELAQNKKRKPITEVPAHLVNIEHTKNVAKNRSKSPSSPNRSKSPKPPMRTGQPKAQQPKYVSAEKMPVHNKPKLVEQPIVVASNHNLLDETEPLEKTQDEEVKMEGLESPPIHPVKKVEPSKDKPANKFKTANVAPKKPKELTKPKQKLNTSVDKTKRRPPSKVTVAEIKCEPELVPPQLDSNTTNKNPADDEARKQILLEENLKKVKLALQTHAASESQKPPNPPKKPLDVPPTPKQAARSTPKPQPPAPSQPTTTRTQPSKVEYTRLQYVSDSSPDVHGVVDMQDAEDVDDEDNREYISTIERMQRIESGQENSYSVFAAEHNHDGRSGGVAGGESGQNRSKAIGAVIGNEVKASAGANSKGKVVAQLNYRSLQGPAMVHPTTNHKSRESVRQGVNSTENNEPKKAAGPIWSQVAVKPRGSDLSEHGVPIFASMPVSDGEFEEDPEEKHKEIEVRDHSDHELEEPNAEEILAAHVKKIASLVHRDKQRREQKAELKTNLVPTREEDGLFIPGKPIPRYVKENSSEAIHQASNHSSRREKPENLDESEEEPSPDFKGREIYESGKDDVRNLREQVNAFQKSTQAKDESAHGSDHSDQEYSREPSDYDERSRSVSDPDRDEESHRDEHHDGHDIEVADDWDPKIEAAELKNEHHTALVRQSHGRQDRYAEPSDGESESQKASYSRNSRRSWHPRSDVNSAGEEHRYDEDELFEQPRTKNIAAVAYKEDSRDVELEDWERGDVVDDDAQSSSTSRSYSLEYNAPAHEQHQQDSIHSQVVLESLQDTSSHNSKPLEESGLSAKQHASAAVAADKNSSVQRSAGPTVDTPGYAGQQPAQQKKTYSAAEVLAKMKMLCAAMETDAQK